MSPTKLLVLSVCVILSRVLAVLGQDGTKVRVCDKDGYYACQCDEIAKMGSDFYSVFVECSFKNLTVINDNMLLPEFVDHLDLSVNHIIEITNNGVLESTTMTSLYLSRNKIEKIAPDSFQGLPNLRELDLSENRIASIEAWVFHGIYKLQYLHLHTNKLKTLPEYAFQNLPKLEMLVLDNNDLGEFLANMSDVFSPGGPSISPRITSLHLSYVNLSLVPPLFFRSAYNMRELRLAGNPITTFPQLPYTLTALDISDTDISSLGPENFANLPAMRELILNDLNITEIKNHTFYPMKSLNKIEMKNCKNLKYFSPFAFGVNAANENNTEYEFPVLDITFLGSGLRTLDKRLYPLFSRLTNLDLRSNPWNCDCKIKWLLELNVKESQKEFISCNRPPDYQGKKLWSLKPGDLDCKTWSVTIGSVTRVALVIMCIALAGLALWLVVLWPPQSNTRPTPVRVVGPDSPYSRITIHPNREDL